MAYSQYYGKSGDYIKEIQKLLNDKGASLKVDGVWGAETENAYQRLGTVAAAPTSSGGRISTKQNSYGLSYYDYTAPTDAELWQRAQAAVSGEYDAMLMAEEEKAQRLTEALNRSIGALDPVYQKRLDLLDEQFEETRQSLSNDALKRNMGRSTHYLDMVNSANLDHLDMVDAINAEYRQEVDAINREILDVQRELLSNKGVISAKKQNALQKYLDDLKDERDDRIMAMVKYNNSVKETELSLNAKKEAAAAAAAAAAAKSSGSGSRGRTSSAKKSKSTMTSGFEKSVLEEWNKLTKPGRIAFFDSMGGQIYATDRSLYNKLKSDVTGYRQEGYFAAVNKNYNYYANTNKNKLYAGPR